eukprot:1378824-Rhodomonas_salina.1
MVRCRLFLSSQTWSRQQPEQVLLLMPMPAAQQALPASLQRRRSRVAEKVLLLQQHSPPHPQR